MKNTSLPLKKKKKEEGSSLQFSNLKILFKTGNCGQVAQSHKELDITSSFYAHLDNPIGGNVKYNVIF